MKKLLLLLTVLLFVSCSNEIIVKGRTQKKDKCYFLSKPKINIGLKKTRIPCDEYAEFWHNSIYNKEIKTLTK